MVAAYKGRLKPRNSDFQTTSSWIYSFFRSRRLLEYKPSQNQWIIFTQPFFFGRQETRDRSAGSACEKDRALLFRRAGGRYRFALFQANVKLIKKVVWKTFCFSDDLLRDGIRTDYQSAPPAHSMPMAATDARPTATIASKNNTDTDIIISECWMKLLSEPSACPDGKRYGCRLVCRVSITLSRGNFNRLTGCSREKKTIIIKN